MTKILTTLFATAFLLLPLGTLYAEDEIINIDLDDVEIQILEQDTEEMEIIEEEVEEEDEPQERSLAETLEENDTEQIQPERRSFWTILAAILIPSTFIILSYFMLKFFQS